MQKIFNKVTADHSDIVFEPSDSFVWSPEQGVVRFIEERVSTDEGIWSLLHEVGHARLNHTTFRDDLELLIMEVAAWGEAKKLADKYGVDIKQEHIDGCIDSYRDWLHSRSKCVECATHSLQTDNTTYRCYNCGTKWKVPASRMCMTRKTRI